MRISLIDVAAKRGALVTTLTIAMSGVALAEASPLDTFGLMSMFVESENKCLDANVAGASKQTDCDSNEAQYWRALVSADNTFFQLTTEATPGLCLQAMPNSGGVQPAGSAATMVACADHPAQKWLFFETDVEYFYRLRNFAGGTGFCLEGNRVSPGAVLDGAAYLDSCADVSGQYWKIGGAVPENGIPTPLE